MTTAARIEEVPYFGYGDIVTWKGDPTNAEHYVTRQMPKNVAVTRLTDGAKLKGDAKGWQRVRSATAEDTAKFESFNAPIDSGITEGAVVTLQTSKKSIGSMSTEGLFAVLKISGDKANVTTLGGRTDQRYLRVPLQWLQKAEITVSKLPSGTVYGIVPQ